jgi:hypothetical protein
VHKADTAAAAANPTPQGGQRTLLTSWFVELHAAAGTMAVVGATPKGALLPAHGGFLCLDNGIG